MLSIGWIHHEIMIGDIRVDGMQGVHIRQESTVALSTDSYVHPYSPVPSLIWNYFSLALTVVRCFCKDPCLLA